MGTLGRASAAEALGPRTVVERPAPPDHLTEFQANEWRAIVDRMPADWFTRETHGLLIQYVRHLENAQRLGGALNATAADDLGTDAGVARFDRLSSMHEREGRAMSLLATRMRLTHQAKYTPRAAGSAAQRAGTGPKPWELRD